MNPFGVVRDFEEALCEYTGAPYAVTTTSCTMALLLAVAWHLQSKDIPSGEVAILGTRNVEIPKRTYIGVPMSIVHAGARPTFRDEKWVGAYQLKPLPVWDSARYFTGGLYKGKWHRGSFSYSGGVAADVDVTEERDCSGQMICVSFHWSKTLGIQQGGAILHDDPEADRWLRKARFDGRTEGVAPADDVFDMLGWHAYMAPETAAAGLVRLAALPRHNDPLPWDEYPDLSQLQIFR